MQQALATGDFCTDELMRQRYSSTVTMPVTDRTTKRISALAVTKTAALQ
jgi:hypothetical protein